MQSQDSDKDKKTFDEEEFDDVRSETITQTTTAWAEVE